MTLSQKEMMAKERKRINRKELKKDRSKQKQKLKQLARYRIGSMAMEFQKLLQPVLFFNQ
jgi:hypothetical protein